MFRVKPLSVEGCFLITPKVHMQNTCDLINVFSNEQFNIYGLSTEFKEEYYAIVRPGTIRGLHFQAPPEAHDKVVTCALGEIRDVVVDLRKDSKTFGKYTVVELNEVNKELLYIPKGCAHGYYVTSKKEALIFYKVTNPFKVEYKGGIHWNSLGIPWGASEDIEIDKEDENLPRFEDFESPF